MTESSWRAFLLEYQVSFSLRPDHLYKNSCVVCQETLPHLFLMRWAVLGANGRLTRRITARLQGETIPVRVRVGLTSAPEVVKAVAQTGADAVVLGQRMRRPEDLRFLASLADELESFGGCVVTLGSTTEYWPIPFKGTYGALKRDAVQLLSGVHPRRYRIIHVICPADVLVDPQRVANMITEHVRAQTSTDIYLSATRSLTIHRPYSVREYREALRDFARSWYTGLVLTITVLVVIAATLTIAFRDRIRLLIVSQGVVLALLAFVIAYAKSGFHYPGVISTRARWTPKYTVGEETRRRYADDGIVVIPGELDVPASLLEGSGAYMDTGDIDNILHSPTILQIVQYVTQQPFQPSTMQGRSPWMLRFNAPAKAGKWHVDQRFCPTNLRLILNLQRCVETDYYLEYVSTSGEKRRIQPDTGDIVLISTRTLHKPSAMTMGCRQIAFLDFVSPRCTINLVRLTIDKLAHMLKKMGWRV